MPSSAPSPFAAALLAWYADHQRALPWRGLKDPYAIWVSEVMLQQTQVATVVPYFRRWMARFPTVEALAAADEQEVLALWEGLGYYRRARALHRAAREIVAHHHGRLPADPQALRRLPGIGKYTAHAVASLAFGADVPVLDGNVRRVLARVFAVEAPADTAAGEKALWALAAQHLPPGRAADYNQALMDLGATICTPRAPRCAQCPVAEFCQAHRSGNPEAYPRKQRRQRQPHYIVVAAVIRREGKVLVAQRPADGLLGSLWEFPGGKVEHGETLEAALQREIREELDTEIAVEAPFGVYRHAYTHFKVTLHAFLCRLVGPEPRPLQAQDVRWARPAGLDAFPMGKIDRQIARRVAETMR